MKLYTGPGFISCGHCGYSVFFEPVDRLSGYTKGYCTNLRCECNGRIFRMPLPIIEVEFIDGENNGSEAL